MANDKWSQVKEILDAAIHRKPEERPEFLDQACRGDRTIRREVESLLSSFEKVDGFMDEPAIEAATVKMQALPLGQMIGKYEIIKKLGEGGMGAVYLARDTTLHRNVAIKMLSSNVASDVDRLRRLEQEAVAASALNHPNILTIHEIGESEGVGFIVSEYVDGVTIREKFSELSTAEAVEIVVQIASALEAAHNQGIIHRDIKPENIMIRDDGLVKLLDFGLSKLTGPRDGKAENEAETLALVKTEPGIIMGTASYMSPEQARGQSVDNRTDIWSLGVMFYEMLSGHTPFDGDTAMDVIASILHKEPPPLPAEFSPAIVAVVACTLEKKKEQRYETAGQMLSVLRSLKVEPGSQSRVELHSGEVPDKETKSLPRPTTSAIRSPASKWIIAVSVIAAALISGLVFYWSYGTRASNPAPNSANNVSKSPAYDLYVRGKLKVTSVNPDDNTAAIKLLEQAVATDPNYAEAWAALAKGYIFRSFNFAPASEQKKLNEDAEVAVEKSLELDPNLAEGHLARGLVLWTHARRFPHEQAIQAFKRSIALNPDLDEAHQWLSAVYIHIGLFDEATQEINKTLEINPSNPTARLRMIAANTYQGKYEDAVSIVKTTPPDRYPAHFDRMTADCLVHLGRIKEATAIIDDYLKTYPDDEGGNITSVKAVIAAQEGRRQESEAIIQRAIEIGQGYGHFHHTAYNIASAYAIMNKPDEAMKWLQNAADDGFPCYPYFEIDHNLDNLRNDPRFIEFMAKGKIQMEKYRVLVNS